MQPYPGIASICLNLLSSCKTSQAQFILVRSTLTDMKLAIEGTIVMSDELRVTLDNMYDARLPEKWAKLSWQSTTLGFWYTELLERDGQFRRWCYHGRPKVHMSSFETQKA